MSYYTSVIADNTPHDPGPCTPLLDGSPTFQNSSGKPTTILIVEDEATLRVPVAKILRRQGFAVLETDDGGPAVSLFLAKATDIDVVLLDVTLPTMSGAEVLTELQRIRPNVKVILTSAFSEETVMHGLEDRRPWAYIRKPYSPRELADLLRRAHASGERTAAPDAS